jgi:hypothetical protein
MGGSAPCDPRSCFTLDRVRLLEFTGYGNYPEDSPWFAITYSIYCADDNGCPVGPPLWQDNHTRTAERGWTYIDIVPPLSLCPCTTQPGDYPRILFTVTHVGRGSDELLWGTDNIRNPVSQSCNMHDVSCLPAVYPRPYNSHYGTMHSGYYGNGGFQYCPPSWLKDMADSTPDGSLYGFCELAMRVYLSCSGPSRTESVSWGSIKSLYR